ncbi:hypothetical protein BDW22DRAFT_1464303 [Trametopsis cervina]|nr:hypothetical protein BDW22DRAFT_1464303 [Trametopsis cervina]
MPQEQATTLPLSILQQIYISGAANALFIFEYGITLGREIDIIWRRRFSLGTALFILTRYSTLALSTQLLWGLLPVRSLRTCAELNIILPTLNAAQFLCYGAEPIPVFTALRGYSLLQRTNLNLVFSVIICVLSLMPLLIDIVIFSTDIPEYLADISSCAASYGISPTLNLRLSLTSRISATLGDIIVLTITWHKTMSNYRAGRKHNLNVPLTTLLIRDGTMYFIVLLLINILTMLFNNLPSLVNLQLETPFLQGIPPILICRFMMNLRDMESNSGETAEYDERTWSSMRFVGNMGQTLLAPAEEEDGEGWDNMPPLGQEEQREGSNDASSLSEIDNGVPDFEVGREDTMSQSESVDAAAGEDV